MHRHVAVGAIGPRHIDEGVACALIDGIEGLHEGNYPRIVAVIRDGEGHGRAAQGLANRDIRPAQEELVRRRGIRELKRRLPVPADFVVNGVHLHTSRAVGLKISAPGINGRRVRPVQTIRVLPTGGRGRAGEEGRRPVRLEDGRVAVVGVIHAALGDAGRYGEVRREIPQGAVGAVNADGEGTLALAHVIVGVGQAKVTRPRRAPTDQSGHVHAVAQALAAFWLHPDIIGVVELHQHPVGVRIEIVGVHPNERIRLAAAHLVEGAADHDRTVALQARGQHHADRFGEPKPVQPGELVEGAIHEPGIQEPVGIEAREAQTPGAIIGLEHATDIERAVRLRGDGVHRIVGTCAGVKAIINAAIGIESGNARARRRANARERPAEHHLTGVVNPHGIDRPVQAGTEVVQEAVIQRPVAI